MTTAHPLFRMPVFLMGMLGGLQVLRAHNNKDTFEDPNLDKNILHTILPWGCGSSSSCCKKTEGEKGVKPMNKKQSTKIWRKRVDFSAFLYIGFLTALCITKVALDVKYEEEDSK